MRYEYAASLWESAVAFPPGKRQTKPREKGLTMVIDKGLGLEQTRDLLETAAPYIDYIKFAFGTSLLYPPAVLAAKIEAIRQQGIDVYPGGTLYELACAQGQTVRFARRARELGFTALEVSEGTLDLSKESRRSMIDAALDAGLQVVTEIGKKDPNIRLDPAQAAEEVAWDLAAGARLVIVEGRDSGVGVGAYDDGGAPRRGFVEGVLASVDDPDLLMWEAPQGSQQLFWIRRLGPDVNLGNVQADQVVTLEAMRRGLRGDTMRQALARQAESD